MLIPIFLIISLAAAVLAYSSGLALGLAVLVFAGCYLAVNIIYIAWAFSTSALVKDLEKPIEKEIPVCRFAAVSVFGLLCSYMGLRVKVTGEELLPADEKFLLVCNHRSGFDPVVIMHELRAHKVSFIAKPSVMALPFIGKVAYGVGCLAIDRENDRNALKTIITAANYLKKGVCNMSVFPEGTRSRTGKLLPFHAGSFKIAQRGGSALVIASMAGTGDIMKNVPLRKTDVHLRILEVIPAEKVKAMSTQELADYSSKLIAASLEEDKA